MLRHPKEQQKQNGDSKMNTMPKNAGKSNGKVKHNRRVVAWDIKCSEKLKEIRKAITS